MPNLEAPNKLDADEQKLSPEEAVKRIARAREMLLREVHKVIIGQEEMIEHMLICLFARGHCLTIGAPGLAKTLTVSTLARALHMKFSRVQFTPDLMPSDITGTDVIEEDPASGRREFRFVRGPIFANIVLADEINRAPPKTQSALLQAMQEYQVTALGSTYELDQPFLVMATQNPIEQEGTYPLPKRSLTVLCSLSTSAIRHAMKNERSCKPPRRLCTRMCIQCCAVATCCEFSNSSGR